MGQQQILFLILGVCIIGIAMSAGSIVMQSSLQIDQRQVLRDELQKLAVEARAYRNRSFEESGGDGTFIGLTATPQGLFRLTHTPSTPFGEFFITKSGNSQCVQILAIGNAPGNDSRKPIKMMMTVFAESASISILN